MPFFAICTKNSLILESLFFPSGVSKPYKLSFLRNILRSLPGIQLDAHSKKDSKASVVDN